MTAFMTTLNLVNFYHNLYDTSLGSFFKTWYMEYIHNYDLDLLLNFTKFVHLFYERPVMKTIYANILLTVIQIQDRHIKFYEIL